MYTIISDELTEQLKQPIRPILSNNRSTGPEAKAQTLEVCPRNPRAQADNPWLSPFPDDRTWQGFLNGLLDELRAHPECVDVITRAFQKMEQVRS